MDRGEGAHPAQIVVMFALFATALVGALGLATDLGISFAGRRAMQNAADAAAYAGARKVAKAASTAGVSVQTEVSGLISNNGYTFASATPTVACAYVTDADAAVGDCSATVPATATGVKVTVTETHPTFFLRVVPGGPETATTSATATAHVKIPGLTGAGPFIVCATDTVLAAGGKMNILNKVSGSWQLNMDAVGKTFNIHEPSPSQFNKCGIGSSKYKGIADSDANKNLTAGPGDEKYFAFKEGDTASISVSVPGIQGCQAGTSGKDITNCVAYLPIAVIDASHPPQETGSDKKIWTVGFAAFLITADGANAHTGKLLADYIVKGSGSSGWTTTYFGPVVIKLTK
ncbi:MAG TPA: pilus assembly protein TadG-related protein [Thermomicrobiales bacterium]